MKQITFANMRKHQEVDEPKKNDNMYVMSTKENIIYYSIGISLCIMVGYVFYNKFIICALLTPLSIIYVKRKKVFLLEKQKQELSLQFKDAIYSISSALNAGYSVERAFYETIKDLKLIYVNSNTMIIQEFELMVRQLEMNIPIENVLIEFANRTQVEDIIDFVDVFVTCKRTGGDLIKIIRDTSKTIAEKIEIKREIQLLITAKKFEQKIMSIIPFAIILYLWLTSPGFLDVMYTTPLGMVVMTVCLIIYAISYIISKKIMDIEV